jgi:hypothetical protein
MPHLGKATTLIFALSAFAFFGARIVSAQTGPGTAIAGDVAVSSLIDQATKSIQSIISQVSADTTLNAFAIRQDLELLLQQLNQDASALEGKTFHDLNQQQQSFFQHIANTLQAANASAAITIHQVDDLVADANDALGTIPGADRDPRVLHYDPQYSVSGGPNVLVAIRGSWLANATPSLAVGGTPCASLSKTEPLLQFECPAGKFPSKANAITPTELQLRVFKPVPWYKSVFGVQGDPVSYNLVVFEVPSQFGTYTITATEPTKNTTNAVRAQKFYDGLDHCQGPKNGVWTVNPSGAGWIIDTTSVSLSEDTKNGSSTTYTIPSKSPGGFQISYTITNSGSCCPSVFGVRACVDGRGWLGVTAHWVEAMTTNSTQTTSVASGPLNWGHAVSSQLPLDTIAFTVTGTMLGTQTAVNVQSGTTKWYSVDYNSDSHVLVLTPNQPNAALQ